MLISRFYYEKSELGEKVRNRIHPYFLFVKPKM